MDIHGWTWTPWTNPPISTPCPGTKAWKCPGQGVGMGRKRTLSTSTMSTPLPLDIGEEWVISGVESAWNAAPRRQSQSPTREASMSRTCPRHSCCSGAASSGCPGGMSCPTSGEPRRVFRRRGHSLPSTEPQPSPRLPGARRTHSAPASSNPGMSCRHCPWTTEAQSRFVLGCPDTDIRRRLEVQAVFAWDVRGTELSNRGIAMSRENMLSGGGLWRLWSRSPHAWNRRTRRARGGGSDRGDLSERGPTP